MYTIKVVRSRGGLIEWTYDQARDANRAWKKITETGRTHDTDESVYNAAYFGPKWQPGSGPDRYWIA